jgi:hypothetical protein
MEESKQKRTISKEHMEKLRLGRLNKKNEVIEEEPEIENEVEDKSESEPEPEEPAPEIIVKKSRGATRERMIELAKIRSEKAKIKNLKLSQIKMMGEDKLNIDYIDALKIREKLNKKKAEIKEHELITSSSKDILKDKFLAEAKKRVMSDLFS